MQVPRFMRRVNRDVTNRIVGLFAGHIPPLAIVHHLGRKTGDAYRTPILAIPTSESFITPLPYGTDTDWCLNVREAGGGQLEIGGREIGVDNPRVVDSESAMPLLPALLRPGLGLAALPGYLLLDRRPEDESA